MKLTIFVNSKKYEFEEIDPNMRLVDLLRDKLGITSVKIGCENGTCGVCTVLVDGVPMRSCITPISKVNGKKILTVEGLGTPENPHPLQKFFIEYDAVQCGFCTPAMILYGYYIVKKNPNVTKEEIKKMISPVLCRCTGYIPIIEAIKAYADFVKRRHEK